MNLRDAVKRLIEHQKALEARITVLEMRIVELEDDNSTVDWEDDTDLTAEWEKEIAHESSPSYQIIQKEVGADIIVSKPSEKQSTMRTYLCRDIPFADLKGIHAQDAVDAYRKGGPLWLLNFDQKFVEQLSPDVRRRMVEDITLTDAEEGLNWGRHLLKVKTEDQTTWAKEAGGVSG